MLWVRRVMCEHKPTWSHHAACRICTILVLHFVKATSAEFLERHCSCSLQALGVWTLSTAVRYHIHPAASSKTPSKGSPQDLASMHQYWAVCRLMQVVGFATASEAAELVDDRTEWWTLQYSICRHLLDCIVYKRCVQFVIECSKFDCRCAGNYENYEVIISCEVLAFVDLLRLSI